MSFFRTILCAIAIAAYPAACIIASLYFAFGPSPF